MYTSGNHLLIAQPLNVHHTQRQVLCLGFFLLLYFAICVCIRCRRVDGDGLYTLNYMHESTEEKRHGHGSGSCSPCNNNNRTAKPTNLPYHRNFNASTDTHRMKDHAATTVPPLNPNLTERMVNEYIRVADALFYRISLYSYKHV